MKTAIPFIVCLFFCLLLLVRTSNDGARIRRLERQVEYLEAKGKHKAANLKGGR